MSQPLVLTVSVAAAVLATAVLEAWASARGGGVAGPHSFSSSSRGPSGTMWCGAGSSGGSVGGGSGALPLNDG